GRANRRVQRTSPTRRSSDLFAEQLGVRGEPDTSARGGGVRIVEAGRIERRHVDVRVDALVEGAVAHGFGETRALGLVAAHRRDEDRKSTRLNSSHLVISYAV